MLLGPSAIFGFQNAWKVSYNIGSSVPATFSISTDFYDTPTDIGSNAKIQGTYL